MTACEDACSDLWITRLKAGGDDPKKEKRLLPAWEQALYAPPRFFDYFDFFSPAEPALPSCGAPSPGGVS